MDQFLASLPKPVLAFGAIFIGFLLIVVMDPPKTICDSQMEIFREAQKLVLYDKPPVNGVSNPAVIKQLHDDCQAGNGPGACFEYFDRLKKLIVDLRNIPYQCSSDASKEAQIKSTLFKAMALMAQIAWGDRGPASITQKYGWFDASDIALFCDLKQSTTRLFGAEAYNQWVTGALSSLTGGEKLSHDQLLQKSLFSVGCHNYR